MRRLSALLVLGLAVGVSGFARPANAQPGKEIAKKLFDEGIELERKSEWQSAVEKYREAEQITVTAGTVFHEGFCLEQLGKLVDALAAYEKAIDLARTQQKPDTEKSAETRAEPLRRKVPQLALKVSPPGAEVLLDGNPVAAGLLDGRPFRVDPGEHTFVVRAAGFKEHTRHVSAQVMATTPVEISLEKVTTTKDPSPITPPPDETPKRDSTLPILTTAGAVVLLGGGIVSFVVAGSTSSDAKDTCAQSVTCESHAGKIRAFDTLAIVGVVGGVGLGIFSGILWARGPKVTVGPTSAWLEGKF